jgi:hypothetical protein
MTRTNRFPPLPGLALQAALGTVLDASNTVVWVTPAPMFESPLRLRSELAIPPGERACGRSA